MPSQQSAHYRLRNWREYNEALVKRGSLTVWFDEDALSQWYQEEPTGKRGSPRVYSDIAIQCGLTLRAVYQLPLRATEGLLHSIVKLLGIDLEVPDYSTLGRRQGTLEVTLGGSRRGAKHIVVDATGLKVFGEGEWKVRQHGWGRRRTWRKLHLAVDPETHVLEAAVVTTNSCHDGEVLGDLLAQIEGELTAVSGDGAYDTQSCYEALRERGANALIAPRKNARIKQHGNCAGPPLARDETLRWIRKQGRRHWKLNSGYSKRSLAEVAMFRYKTLFGDKLNNHLFEHQGTEALIRCRAMNRMTSLGMPDSYCVKN